MAWDSRWAAATPSLSDVLDYAARVAAAVGAMMCVLMRVRDADALARACDLGLAMQLTNIARDVGEDARAARLFLPLDWLACEGIDPEAFLRAPSAPARHPPLHPAACWTRPMACTGGPATGVRRLPLDCRAGILAAGHVYAAIGHQVARSGHDSISRRARTSALRKTALLAWVGGCRRGWSRSCPPRPAFMPARCPRWPSWSRRQRSGARRPGAPKRCSASWPSSRRATAVWPERFPFAGPCPILRPSVKEGARPCRSRCS
jgi:phytoene synthase